MSFQEFSIKFEPKLKILARRYYYFSGAFDSSDLYQEALINLWQRHQNGQLQDKTDAYILRSCYFHIKNFMRTKQDNTNLHSLDQIVSEDSDSSFKDLLEKKAVNPKESLYNKITVQDMLNNGLTRREKEVMRLMLAGSNIREAARELGISHVRVIKIKDNIRRKYQNKI